MRKRLVLLSLLVAIFTGLATAQTASFPGTWYFAFQYNYSIASQQANTYSFFPAGTCNVASPTGSFPAFQKTAPFAPVFIRDANTANNEIVTPTATTFTSASCGLTVAPLNTHQSFWIQSGTAGLQEALNQLPSATAAPALLILDRNWYQAANSLPSTTNPAAIIAAATGNANAYILDVTTVPFTFYSWNGANYVKTALGASGSLAQFFGRVPNTLANIAVPAATVQTVAAPVGIAAGTYRICATYVDNVGGETTCSADSATTVTTTATLGTITVTAPASSTGAVGWRLYVSAAGGAANSEIFYAPASAGCTASLVTPIPSCAIGSNAVFSALITGTGLAPGQNYAHVTATLPSFTVLPPVQQQFGPFTALASVISAQTAAQWTWDAGRLNQLYKKVQICGTLIATEGATGGTMTRVLNLNSAGYNISGTIQPISIATGTLTALAATNTTFCDTLTVAASGSTGTFEAHGTQFTALAGTSASTPYQDNNQVPSAAIDLTKQIYAWYTLAGSTSITSAQIRDLTITYLN